MCDTQRKLIKTFTQESLDKCSSTIKLNFDRMKQDILSDLIDGIRLDIFDNLNGIDDSECKILTPDDIKKDFLQLSPIQEIGNNIRDKNVKNICEKSLEVLFGSKILKNNEHYVYFTSHYSWEVRCNYGMHNYNIIVSLGLITNFSNFIWLVVNDYGVFSYDGSTRQDMHNTGTIYGPCKTYDLNIPLHNIFINILHTNKFLSSRTNPIEQYQPGENTSSIKRYRNIHNTKQNVANHSDIYDAIVKILDLNKKYSIQLLVESDLQKKYDALVKKNEQQQKTVESLETKIEKLENQLKESIPEQHRCCICFGYTDKKKACVPCGHTQYCDNCIGELKKCAICRKDVTSSIPLFM